MLARKSLRNLLPLLLLTFCLLHTSRVAAQLAPAAVRVAPADAQVTAGETLQVAVQIGPVTELYGADVALSFDPAVLELVDADPGEDGLQVGVGTFLDTGFVLINEGSNNEGTVRLAMTQLAPSTPKSGTGNFIVATLRGKAAGSSSALVLTKAELATPAGQVIPAQMWGANVRVVEVKPAGPTATPIVVHAPEIVPPPGTPVSSPPTPTTSSGTESVSPTASPTPPPATPPLTATPSTVEDIRAGAPVSANASPTANARTVLAPDSSEGSGLETIGDASSSERPHQATTLPIPASTVAATNISVAVAEASTQVTPVAKAPDDAGATTIASEDEAGLSIEATDAADRTRVGEAAVRPTSVRTETAPSSPVENQSVSLTVVVVGLLIVLALAAVRMLRRSHGGDLGE